MFVAAREGYFVLRWDGRKWIDRAGHTWRECPPNGPGYEYLSKEHGPAMVLADEEYDIRRDYEITFQRERKRVDEVSRRTKKVA